MLSDGARVACSAATAERRAPCSMALQAFSGQPGDDTNAADNTLTCRDAFTQDVARGLLGTLEARTCDRVRYIVTKELPCARDDDGWDLSHVLTAVSGGFGLCAARDENVNYTTGLHGLLLQNCSGASSAAISR